MHVPPTSAATTALLDGRAPAAGQAVSTGWRGQLQVELANQAGTTVVARRRHQGPLQIQRGFYPEGRECCHLYLLHPPGGLVSGDQLQVEIAVLAQARALVTTPAATKVYRSLPGRAARQEQRLRVASGASLEWLPGETILFDQAQADLHTEVQLEGEARFMGWEIVCLGREAGQAPFLGGRCRQRIEIFRDGRPLLIDRTDIVGGGELAGAAFGLRGQPVLGTFVAAPLPSGEGVSMAEILDGLREQLQPIAPPPQGELTALTALPEALVCRYLGPSAPRARAHFIRLWGLLRPLLLGRPPCPPRIWST